MHFHLRRIASIGFVAIFLAGCQPGGRFGGGDSATSGKGPGTPLYDRLGGAATVKAASDRFLSIAAEDPRIAGRFRGTDPDRFAAGLANRLCIATGGPCKPIGRSMKETHDAMGVSDAEFNSMVQDIRRAFGVVGVSVDLQTELAAALEPMRDEIVSPYKASHSVVAVRASQASQPVRPTLTASPPAASRKPVATTAKKPAAPPTAKAPATKAPAAKPLTATPTPAAKPAPKKPTPKKPASGND